MRNEHLVHCYAHVCVPNHFSLLLRRLRVSMHCFRIPNRFGLLLHLFLPVLTLRSCHGLVALFTSSPSSLFMKLRDRMLKSTRPRTPMTQEAGAGKVLQHLSKFSQVSSLEFNMDMEYFSESTDWKTILSLRV